MKRILVTGARSQLAQCIYDQAHNSDQLQLEFVDREAFDLTQPPQMAAYLETHSFDYCINTAAYTKVEAAESDQELAHAVNGQGALNLAVLCKEHGITLVHISTDYVFDGSQQVPYTEADPVGPINVYGASKLAGERSIQEVLDAHYILRTSWLYSQYGHNFYRSVRKWASERDQLSITTEQIGTPTNANDLAQAILRLIERDPKQYGLYHYSNDGQATWFDFAEAILLETGQLGAVKLVKTDHYPTFAARPKYSVMDCSKFEQQFGNITTEPHWKARLKNLILTTDK